MDVQQLDFREKILKEFLNVSKSRNSIAGIPTGFQGSDINQ